MGTWHTLKSSYQAKGVYSGNLPFNPEGFGAAWSANSTALAPSEGLAHGIKRGIQDSFLEIGNHGFVSDAVGNRIKYGGSLLSGGGWREVTHKVEQAATSGLYQIGAKRTLAGMIKTGALKAITPAVFLYDVSQHGIGQATKDAAINGAIWGAGRWALGRIGVGLMNPAFLGTVALAGGAIAAQKALQMGKRYNDSVRNVSFGNAFNDVYGTAATMRQASLMAIQSSKINGRNALGFEASLMHMR